MTELVGGTGEKCVGNKALALCFNFYGGVMVAGWSSNDTVAYSGEYSFQVSPYGITGTGFVAHIKLAGLFDFVTNNFCSLGILASSISATLATDYSLSAYEGNLFAGAGICSMQNILVLQSCSWASQIIGGEPCEATAVHVGTPVKLYSLYENTTHFFHPKQKDEHNLLSLYIF